MKPKKPIGMTYIFFGIGVFILTGSLLLNQHFHRPPIWSYWGGNSNGFHRTGEADEFLVIQPGTYAPQLDLPLTFRVKVNPRITSVMVVFRYRLRQPYKSLWLTVASESGEVPIRLLLRHHLLEEYRYPSVSDGTMTLYQREVQFSTIGEFLRNIPLDKNIVSERSLTQLWPSLTGAQVLDTTQIEGQPDYILTSYLRPRLFHDEWYEFGRNLNISRARRDPDGSFVVTIEGDPSDLKIDLEAPKANLVDPILNSGR